MMKNFSPAMIFFLIFVLTILLTRTFLYIHPTPGPTVKGIRTHHYMYGLVIIPVAFIFGSISLFAVGVGLFIDELTYLLIGGKTHEDNYSKISLFGTFLFIIIIFLLKDYLIMPLVR